MNRKVWLLNALLLCSTVFALAQDVPVMETGKNMPDAWIDKDTGHKIIRLVRRPGTSNTSFYFNNYCFVPQKGKGDLMVFRGSVEDKAMGDQLFSVNLKTLETKQLTNHKQIAGEMVCPKTSEAFYQSADSVFAVNIITGKNRFVYAFPADFKGSRAGTINADGTYLAVVKAGPQEKEIYAQYPEKKDYFDRIYDAHIEHVLYSLNVKTGVIKEIHRENEWTNHLLFSPVDPQILSYCHEGPWHKVDRIWNINIQTGENKLMHVRTIPREIAGHEFFGIGGQHEWFDLQKPVSTTFYLAGVDMKTGKEDRVYQMDRDEWSIHFNVTKDEKFFCGDGGDPGQVAHAKNGEWIYFFKPEGDKFKSEKLVNMKNHNYHLEPNVHFSPDEKWVIFRANFEGATQIYAAEIAKH
ncbi:oligogalacturonide lyase [Mucilaginibacter yixingensis]|uniref:Oligogalacturonide lyase n=2 Tax=Mucilaginibacter yixingensis TaxID=1295612 RepID=A0A2T5JB44_9SPHI|nr:oligogalacturonide lyase [Mucilaginibacter yixingensis]